MECFGGRTRSRIDIRQLVRHVVVLTLVRRGVSNIVAMTCRCHDPFLFSILNSHLFTFEELQISWNLMSQYWSVANEDRMPFHP